MIRLLEGHSLTERARFQPESQPLTLNQRQSTTRIVVGPAAPEISVGDWLQDMDEPGANIVWRVKSIDNQLETETRTIILEHLINSLRDKIMFGEVKPQTMGGTASGCTALQAVTYILNQQSDWVLGTFEYGSVSNPYAFNGDDLFSGLETVSASLEGCWWSYDFTTYPFTINMTYRASVVSTELRQMRNIQTAKYTIDKSRMYTRLYPIGKNNLHIDGNYVSMNEAIYGIIEKTETDQSKATKAELQRWAEERIRNHCEPSVTWTVQALDYSRETGESLDQIVLGAMCRMPLPGYNTVIEETITQLNYPDKIRDREMCTVTLANIQEDVASIINNLIKSGGGGGRASAKNAEEDHAWFEDTTDHVAMIAEGIAGEGASTDWSRVAELLVDGDGIHQRVQQAQGDIIGAYSLIDQTTTAIRLEIGDVQSQVRSFIEQTPEMIHAEVGSAVSGFAQSVIEQTSTYIRMEVSNAASEISQTVIEQTTEYVQTTVEATASEVAWSVITQTMTNIEQKIARKSKIYIQLTNPNDGVNELFNGDIWIKAESLKTWNENSNSTWNSQNAKEWRSKYGDKHYVWRDGLWVAILDTSTAVENEVELQQTKDSLAIVGHKQDLAGEEYFSQLEVTAQRIRTEVNTASSRIYSVVEQTATNIHQKIANEISGVESIIDQESDRISLVVQGTGANAHIKAAQIVASINGGSSEIKLSANHIDIDGIVNYLQSVGIRVQSLLVDGDITCEEAVVAASLQGGEAIIDGDVTCGDVDCDDLTCAGLYVSDGGTDRKATWHSRQVVTSVAVTYKSVSGTIVATQVDSVKNYIYYLGRG